MYGLYGLKHHKVVFWAWWQTNNQPTNRVNLEQVCLLNSEQSRLLQKHSGERSNKCNQCDFASCEADHLKRHFITHSGEKSDKCNQCDYASSLEVNLRTHLKEHNGEKSNKCNQCDFASSNPSTLRDHLKTHSGEKLKKCSQSNCAPHGQAV